MASTAQDTQTVNTPHPYEGGEPGGAGAASRTSTASRQTPSTQTQQPAASQRQTRSQSGLASRTQSKSQSQSGVVGGRKDTNGVAEPAEEEGGAARGTGTSAAEGADAPSSDKKNMGPEGGYPEQLHAGHVDGLGPEYGKNNKVTMSDRFQGAKEEIKGTIKRDPELKQTGKDRMTGELKRKKDNEKNLDPSDTAEGGDKKDETKDEAESDSKKTRTEKTDEPGLTEHPQAHPTEKGRQEQAASVQPEGSGPTGQQQEAKDNATSGQVS